MLNFEIDPAHQTWGKDGLPMLHPDVVRRCQFMFGVRFYWSVTASHKDAPLGLELTIPSAPREMYQRLFQPKTR